jgi:hypothetical protein
MRCHKCGSSTVPINARVTVHVGDSSLTTIAEARHCVKCGENQMNFQFRIEPMGAPIQQPKVAQMEVKGNA